MFVKNITFLGTGNVVVKSCKITSLPIKEQIIISKSIEFFNDSEPCFIHRSAVMKRLITEIDDYLYSVFKGGINEIKWSAFNEQFGDTLELGAEVGSIRFVV